MFNKFFFIIFLIQFIFSSYIKEIQIFGNKHTRKAIILNAVSHPVDVDFDLKIAQNDKIALSQLECFDEISITSQDSIYYILVKEKPPLTWIPIIKQEDMLGWSAGVQFNINNINSFYLILSY